MIANFYNISIGTVKKWCLTCTIKVYDSSYNLELTTLFETRLKFKKIHRVLGFNQSITMAKTICRI